MHDDATWRLAFATNYGLLPSDGAEPHHQQRQQPLQPVSAGGVTFSLPPDQVVPSLRRTQRTSWKAEYIRRSALLRTWRKSRTPTILTDPRTGPIACVAVHNLAPPHRSAAVHQLPRAAQHMHSHQNQHKASSGAAARFMLSASLLYGVASRSDPFTGKVAKGLVEGGGGGGGGAQAAAAAAAAAAGHQINPAAAVAGGAMPGDAGAGGATSSPVTALSIDADGTRIVWGFASGDVRLSLFSRNSSSSGGGLSTNPRGLLRTLVLPPRDCHLGAVRCVALPFASERGGVHAPMRTLDRLGQRLSRAGEAGQLFVTGGEDGGVRLWSPKLRAAVWSASLPKLLAEQEEREKKELLAQSQQDTLPLTPDAPAGLQGDQAHRPARALRQAPIDKVAYNARGIVAAAAQDGTIAVWLGFDLESLEQNNNNNAARTSATPLLVQPRRFALLNSVNAPQAGVADLIIDEPDVDDGPLSSVTLLVRFFDDAHFYRHDIVFKGDHNAFDVSTCRFGQATSALDKITCLRADFDLEARPSGSRAVSPFVTPATDAAHLNDVPPLVLGPSKEASPRVDEELRAFRERKYVCVGTSLGALRVYPWAPQQGQSDTQAGVTTWKQSSAAMLHLDQPAMACEAGGFEVTALDFNSHMIFCGFADGSIKVFNSLTGQLVRSFADRAATRHPARMLAAGELTDSQAVMFRVTQIIAAEDAFVGVIGSHVLAWRCDDGRALARKGGKSAATSGKSRHPLRRMDPKFQAGHDLDDDLHESTQKAREEALEERERLQNLRTWQQDAGYGDMSEQEAFAYAMMLSRDELDNSRADSSLLNEEDEEEELQQALRAIEEQQRRERSPTGSHQSDDDLNDALGELSFEAQSNSVSPSLRAVSSPSRAWDILANASSSRGSSSPWRRESNTKVQTIVVPRSARLSPHHGRRSDVDGDLPDVDSPRDWPSVSPMSTSLRSSSSASLSHSQSRRESNAWASPLLQPADASSHSSSLGAWAAGSPHRNASFSPSLLARDLQRDSTGRSPEASRSPLVRASNVPADEMDDDMRFAIELSLAEERSRQQL